MRTVKLVVIGNSGVGKTSLRGKYTSGQFTNGYRATIGADFISKSVPHRSNPSESITLQIWDTAGQERFSSLSAAFFRGADAVLLMYDVNRPETLDALERWWDEFRERAPVPDDEASRYCAVFVGNKSDLVKPDCAPAVSLEHALDFIETLIPPPSPASSPLLPESDAEAFVPRPLTLYEDAEEDSLADDGDDVIDIHDERDGRVAFPTVVDGLPPPTSPLNIEVSKSLPKSPRSATQRFLSTASAAPSALTTLSFHTASSSLIDSDASDVFASARATPLPFRSPSRSPSRTRTRTRSSRSDSRPRVASLSSLASSSAQTVTPSLFARGAANNAASASSRAVAPTATPPTPPDETLEDPATNRSTKSTTSRVFPDPPESRPRLFTTSAKTGEGVLEVFEYVAHRVVAAWEWEEATSGENVREADDVDRIELGRECNSKSLRSKLAGCCAT